jgi:hypothetical protein
MAEFLRDSTLHRRAAPDGPDSPGRISPTPNSRVTIKIAQDRVTLDAGNRQLRCSAREGDSDVPSRPMGRLLVDFFKTDSTTRSWFLRPTTP